MIETLTARIACFMFDTPRLNPSEHFDGIGQAEWPALIEAHASIDPGRVRPIRARYYDAADRHFRRWFFAQPDQFRRMYLCPSSKHLAQVWRGVNGERASSGVGF